MARNVHTGRAVQFETGMANPYDKFLITGIIMGSFNETHIRVQGRTIRQIHDGGKLSRFEDRTRRCWIVDVQKIAFI